MSFEDNLLIHVFFIERYDFVVHADKANCIDECGMINSNIIKEYSNGVFPIRFNGYMNAKDTALHQQAFLVYNKKGVQRSLALRRLNEIELKSEPQLWTNLVNDKNNKYLWPILNFPNYAPYEGDPLKYSDPNLISLNQLKACIGMSCEDDTPGNAAYAILKCFLD